MEAEEELQAQLEQARRAYLAKHPGEKDVAVFWIGQPGHVIYTGPMIKKARQERLPGGAA